MLCDETVGGRGGNEISSCLITWALHYLPKDVEEITIWTDNYGGQNRNATLYSAYMWLLSKIPSLQVINHKYLLRGHTHMEADCVYAIIERKKKHLKTLEISVPRDWAQFIRTCGNKKPFIVHEMTLKGF